MRQSRWPAVLVAICVLAAGSSASAQFWPGNPYGGNGAWGGYPYGQFQTNQAIAAENRQLGQVAAMGQNLVVQNGIRSTLSNQADNRTNAILGQRQANRDWWFQYQSQQSAQRRAQPSAETTAAAFEPAGPAAAAPVAATDIIAWPILLQRPSFAPERARIEAPYRRTPPRLSTPTADDYREMVKTVESMRGILEWLTREGVETQQYDEAKAFLAKLGEEARERAGQALTPEGR